MTNEVIKCLENHRSIRKFKNQEVPSEIVEKLLNTGIRAASGGNLQTYSFVVVDDLETKRRLAEMDKFNNIMEAPLIIVALVDTYRIKRWFDISNTAPTCVNKPIHLFMSYWDAIIALHNITTAAESLGLGAYYNGNILEFDIQELFGTPEYVFPAGMLCLGYPDQEKNLSERLPLEAVVHRNKYNIPTDDDIRDFYKKREDIWNIVSDNKKVELKEENIFSIPQAIAKQKFSEEITSKRSKNIMNNVRRSGFELQL